VKGRKVDGRRPRGIRWKERNTRKEADGRRGRGIEGKGMQEEGWRECGGGEGGRNKRAKTENIMGPAPGLIIWARI
jgi:hypothetical protein